MRSPLCARAISRARLSPNPGDRNQHPPRPDFAAAAAKLGVTEQQLIDAVGVPPHSPGDGGASHHENLPNQPE